VYCFEPKIPKPSISYVDDDFNSSTIGWQYDHFDVIQGGIDAVAENGTVYVFNGTYYENVIVNKTIDLIGEDRNGTIIDGGGSKDVVHVTAGQVNISGFKIVGSGSDWGDAGIELISSNNTISNNIVIFNWNHGIRLDSSSNNTITGNIANSNNNHGISLYSSCNNNLTGNKVSNNNYGIYLWPS